MSMRSYLSDVKETQVIDRQTVKFILNQRQPRNQTDRRANADLVKKIGDGYFDKVGLTPLMGSGAYKVGTIDAGRAITYVRDPNYWGAKPDAGVVVNVGRYNFDQIKCILSKPRSGI